MNREAAAACTIYVTTYIEVVALLHPVAFHVETTGLRRAATGLVIYRIVAGGGAEGEGGRFAFDGRRGGLDLHDTLAEHEWGEPGLVVVGDVIPAPAVAVGQGVAQAHVAVDGAADYLEGLTGHLSDQGVESCIVKLRVHAAHHVEVAVEGIRCALLRLFGPHLRAEGFIGLLTVEGGDGGEQLHVTGRAAQFVGLVGVERTALVQVVSHEGHVGPFGQQHAHQRVKTGGQQAVSFLPSHLFFLHLMPGFGLHREENKNQKRQKQRYTM